MHIHIHHYDGEVVCKLDKVLARLACLEEKVDRIMVDLSKLEAAVEKQTTVTSSAVTLIQGLAEQIRNLPLNQAAIDDLASKVESQAQSLADAVTTNTPSA